MGSGGDKKPQKAKVTPTVSTYQGVDSGSFNTDFGSGYSSLMDKGGGKKEFATTAKLSDDLRGIGEQAGQGLSNNLSYLQKDPNERVGFMTSGQDPMYNVLQAQADQQLKAAQGRQLVNAQQGGIRNSTTLGSALGRIAGDDMLRRNQILLSGLNYGNENARADAQLGMATLSGLHGLVTPLGSAAASQLQTANAGQDAAQAATANAMNQEAQRYAAAMDQYNRQKAQSMGSMIGGGIGLAGSLALAPFTGGASLLAAPGMMSGMFGGGGGSAPVASSGYQWTNPFSKPVDYAGMGNRIGIGGLESSANLQPLISSGF